MLKHAIALLLLATPALSAETVLTFAFKTEKLDLDASGLADASQSFDQNTNQPLILFRLSKPATRAFGEITARHVNEPMDLIVCGKIVTSPVIREPIYAGSGQISGTFTVEEAQALAVMLKEGRCDVTAKKPGAGGDGGSGGAGPGQDVPGS
jgi:preprotein translocase subunit SecD